MSSFTLRVTEEEDKRTTNDEEHILCSTSLYCTYFQRLDGL